MRNLITNIHKRCKGNRFLWVMTSLLIYSIVAYESIGTVGIGIAAFSILPASVAGLLYGSRAGAVIGIIMFFYNSFLLFPLQVTQGIITESSGIGYVAVITVGYIVGYFNEMRVKLKKEIEERREVEAQLARANERLTDQAERAAQARSFFLGAISHELRTPMNAVIGMTDIMLGTPLKPEQLEYMQTIQSSGQAMLEIIDNILDFTKIESGALQLDEKPVNLRICIDEVFAQVAKQATHKKVQLLSDIHSDVSLGQIGDSARLQQILLNLVENAIKFTKDGEVRVTVRSEILSNESQEMNLLLFTIQDNGMGIHSNDLEHLFEPFTQDDLSTTRKYGGVGLGLTICRSLAERMGGKIWAESEWGSGSTFYFTIKTSPCVIEMPTSNPKTQAESMTSDPSAQLYPLKILLAEDNRVNQKVATRVLQRLGYQVDVVDNGLQAFEQITEKRNHYEPYDLVLMDIHMPVMDGAEATIRIRKLGPQIPQPYIIALTADVLWEDQTHYTENGMNDYVGKPIMIQGISEALAKASVALKCSAEPDPKPSMV